MLNTIQESILNILKKVKESILNNDEFTESFDKYLMPNDIDRKNYAEIPTPYILRQTMLDKMPEEFWKSNKNGALKDRQVKWLKTKFEPLIA